MVFCINAQINRNKHASVNPATVRLYVVIDRIAYLFSSLWLTRRNFGFIRHWYTYTRVTISKLTASVGGIYLYLSPTTSRPNNRAAHYLLTRSHFVAIYIYIFYSSSRGYLEVRILKHVSTKHGVIIVDFVFSFSRKTKQNNLKIWAHHQPSSEASKRVTEADGRLLPHGGGWHGYHAEILPYDQQEEFQKRWYFENVTCDEVPNPSRQ